jgi:hypothetical protein
MGMTKEKAEARIYIYDEILNFLSCYEPIVEMTKTEIEQRDFVIQRIREDANDLYNKYVFKQPTATK